MANITQKITPFLWFDKEAEEAATFYTSIFKKSSIGSKSYYGEGAPLPEGTILTVEFTLNDEKFTALNGGPIFKFNESVSFVVHCDSQDEIDYYWEQLLKDGGKESQCGWLKDKFGLSWQVVPDRLLELLMDKDKEKANRVMQAMMKMVKIDIAVLEEAVEEV
ncbi:MAG TPA: VOC family protein [Parafilimonas sp.]|nr:VOC family protein [Parafilimonas sp.]